MMVLPMSGTRLSTMVAEMPGANETTMLPRLLTYAAVTEAWGGLCTCEMAVRSRAAIVAGG